jgi:hypothetical protein
MAAQRTVTLSWAPRRELEQARDHDPRPYVRERCAALLKIAGNWSGGRRIERATRIGESSGTHLVA